MLPDLTHYPVNWVDGMKIARRHFTETDQFVLDHLRDAVALELRADRYGLLPTTNELGSPAAFELLPADAPLPPAIGETRDLGYMLWDIDHAAPGKPSAVQTRRHGSRFDPGRD